MSARVVSRSCAVYAWVETFFQDFHLPDFFRHTRESGYPFFSTSDWIPAYAGMTDPKAGQYLPKPWIPAYAGMTKSESPVFNLAGARTLTTATYETDFYLWTQQQAALLRSGALSALDVEHLIEEIEDMGKRDRRAMGSYLRNILMHLLKWQYQPERRATSWQGSINSGRVELEVLLNESPSLNSQLLAALPDEYRRARKQASLETGLPLSAFPDECPFTLEHITGDYWPD